MNYILTQEELDNLRANHEKEAREKYKKLEAELEARFQFILTDFVNSSNIVESPQTTMMNSIRRYDAKKKHEKEIRE